MKNVKFVTGHENWVEIATLPKQHIELHDAGMTVIKCGWSKFPTKATWVKNGGTEEDYVAIMSACNALYVALKNSDRASERLNARWDTSDAQLILAEDANIIAAIQNLGKVLGHRVDNHHRIKANVVEVNAKTIRCWYKLLAGRRGICAPDTFAPKAVVYIMQLMQGIETPDEALREEREAMKENGREGKVDKMTEAKKRAEEAEEQVKTERERADSLVKRAERAEDECRELRTENKELLARIAYLEALCAENGVEFDKV